MDLNVLIRGQSNALLFADRGGAAALEQGLEARLGVDVHLLYQWGTDTSTIWSGTAFMDWGRDGEEASLLRYLDGLPADLKHNPTVTLWMHNENDQANDALTTGAWLGAVRADAAAVRAELGQDAGTTPYEFVPIRYPYGGNFDAIGNGMAALDADPSFNAGISWAAQSLAMDGGPEPGGNTSHMGDADALRLGHDLAASMAEALRPLVNGPAPAALLAGSDTLVLRVPPPDAQPRGVQHTVEVDDFQARYGALPDQGFVERLYLDALGRPGEEGGVAHWTGALDAGALSRAEVAAGFASSGEMAAKLAPLAADGVFFV